ncbi:hypothetical protein F3Y22_tig00001869pilonHSYRG00010 [Hibiscus syriacus]|uniref:Uncharacterized protein n=1 Tax=Hibiscus syriacus TaxID=106335 RepID=A0A6A3CYP5_HIBSY|nr:hypothetical protein F3Y22_tig00001869pilonHSYRG00010 [Hibiscus syriacus]
MSAPQTLGGPSRCGRVLGQSLDKIIKSAAWIKHSYIVSSCKFALEKLDTLSDTALPDPSSPLLGLSTSDANLVLSPILVALDFNHAEPALDSVFNLFSLGVVRGEIVSNLPNSVLYKIVESVCEVGGICKESVELTVLRVLLSAVRCPCVLICSKSVLALIVIIVFARAEEDSMDVSMKIVPVSELSEFTDKNLNEGSSIFYCQNLIREVITASEGVSNSKFSLVTELQNGESKVSNGEEEDEVGEEDMKEGVESSSGGEISKIREDGFYVFKNLCKLSLKFSSQGNPNDEILLRGKTVSLELLDVIMGDAAADTVAADLRRSTPVYMLPRRQPRVSRILKPNRPRSKPLLGSPANKKGQRARERKQATENNKGKQVTQQPLKHQNNQEKTERYLPRKPRHYRSSYEPPRVRKKPSKTEVRLAAAQGYRPVTGFPPMREAREKRESFKLSQLERESEREK